MDVDDTRPDSLLPEPSSGRDLETVFPEVYDKLRALARRRFAGERSAHTLQPTDLVHDVWLRLATHGQTKFESRLHFFNAAAEAMRRILIEHARAKARLKRVGGRKKLPLDEGNDRAGDSDALTIADERSDELLDLDVAIEKLKSEDSASYNVVMLHFFLGLIWEEVGECMGTSARSAKRTWDFARASLYRKLGR